MHESSWTRPGWLWLLLAICVLIVGLWFLANSTRNKQAAKANLGEARNADTTSESKGAGSVRHSPNRSKSANSPTPTPEEVVAGKLQQFGANRHNLVQALAEHFKYRVPDGVERFFEAV